MYSSFGMKEDRFNFRVELPVHQGHLKFKLEIGNRSQPAHDGMRALRGGEFHQQPVHGRDSHGIDRNRLPQHGEPLVRREQGLLLIVNRHRHDDFVESVRALSMTSRWPFVTGSKLPG